MCLGIKAKQANIICDDGGIFSGKQTRFMKLGISDPARTSLALIRVAIGLNRYDNGSIMMAYHARWCGHTFFEIRHNMINARCQSFGLPCHDILCEAMNFRIGFWLCQPCLITDRANANKACILKIGKGFEMSCALVWAIWDSGDHLIDMAITDRIHHRLMVCHRINNMVRIVWF